MALTWRRAAAFWPVLVFSLWGVLAFAEEAATEPHVEAVRLGVDARGQTRIVFDMDARPAFAVEAREGEHIAVAIHGATFAVAEGEGVGVVTRYRATDGGAVLTLDEPALPVRSFVLPPAGDVAHYRLVIDLEGVEPSVFAKAVPEAHSDGPIAQRLAAAEAELAPSPTLKPERQPPAIALSARDAKVIVIDPGHGGHDPGASGASGHPEEVATLEAAKALSTILTARGYEVVLTREDDSYVDHEERIELARRRRADLFLSLHADAHDDPDLRGASVYTLSEKRSARMAREIKRSGDFHLYDVALSEDEQDVGAILFDLANSTTQNESGRLAAALIDELQGTVPMINNTHRKAGLKVLLAPDVPAVLFEMAFISNPEDEANLRSARWRRTAMTAVADGIDDYFGARMATRTATGPAGG